MTAPDLDMWLPRPAIRVAHHRPSPTDSHRLWQAAREIRLSDTRLLGRLIRWRIPGVPPQTRFDELFRAPPFILLKEDERWLLSGLVGKIWTLRRDYPVLAEPEQYRAWSRSGTVRVLFAHWVEPDGPERAVLHSETRVEAFGAQGRLGLAGVRPLIRGFQHLVATDALAAAARSAEHKAQNSRG